MISCRYCNLDKIVKAGFVKLDKYGNRQRYLCKDCRGKFVEDINSQDIQKLSKSMCG